MSNTWQAFLDREFSAFAKSQAWGDTLFPVIHMSAHEKILAPYDVQALVVLDNKTLDPKKGLGKSVKLQIGDKKKPLRFFVGDLVRYEYQGSFDKQHIYKIWLAPALWKLSLDSKFRIFQDKKKREIIKSVLGDAGIQITSKLLEKGNKIETDTQYNETTLDYVTRLLEEEGLVAYFVPNEEAPKWVLAEAPQKTNKIEFEFADKFVGKVPPYNYLLSFKLGGLSIPDKHDLYDYNFLTPDTKTIGTAQSSAWTKTTIETYPTQTLKSQDAKNSATLLKDADSSREDFFEAESTYHLAAAGQVLTLKKHPIAALNSTYIIEEVIHTLQKTDNGWEYKNIVRGVKFGTLYAPKRTKCKPMILGTQTAKVVGPKDKEIYVDANGRVKILFIWDHATKTPTAPSAWVRLTQWGAAGNSWGNISIPRVGQEVVVGFLNGDPDYPIVLGSVFNGLNAFPYKLPDNAQIFAIKTQSTPKDKNSKEEKYSEFKIDDKANSEKISLRAQKDGDFLFIENFTTTLNEGSQTTTVKKGDYKLTLSGDEKPKNGKGDYSLVLAKGNRTEELQSSKGSTDTLTITKGTKTLHIKEGNDVITLDKGDLKITISNGNMEINLTGKQTNTISKDRSSTISGEDKVSAKSYALETTQGAAKISATGDFQASSKGSVKITGTSGITIESQGSLTLKGATVKIQSESTMDIQASAMVNIKGAMIKLN